MDPIIPHEDTLLDLYHRYSGRLLAAATDRLAAIGPDATQLDEDITQDVWAAVAAGHYPADHHGLDGLLALLDTAIRKVRVVRSREWPAGLPQTRRPAESPDLLEDLAHVDTAPTRLRRLNPATNHAAPPVGLRALEVA